MSSTKLQKNFKTSVCCPTPKHVTIQLFINIHYLEFCCMGQTDADETEDKRFFTEAINKSVHDAISNYNEIFLNTFHNTMKEVFHGFLVDQVAPAYYNIPHPSTQGTNQIGTSRQEAAPAGNDDVQAVQSSSEQAQGVTTNQIQYNHRSSVQHVQQPAGQGQNQVINFGTSGHIPSSVQKIAPSIQRIR